MRVTVKTKDSEFVLASDPMQYWIEEWVAPHTTESGKEVEGYYKRITGYYTKYSDLYKDFLEKRLKGSNAQSFNEALAVLYEAYDVAMEGIGEKYGR